MGFARKIQETREKRDVFCSSDVQAQALAHSPEAGGDKSLLQKARTKLGAATFVSRFHQKKADVLSARFAEKQAERRKKELKAAVLALREAEMNVRFHQKKADVLSARFAEKQAERRKKELKAAVLALREAEMNVKVKELEIALAEAGGVDVDSEAGDVEVVDLEKEEEKSPGSVVPTTAVKKQPGSPPAAHPSKVASMADSTCGGRSVDEPGWLPLSLLLSRHWSGPAPPLQ
eukprot:s5972_g3.t1